MNMPPPSPIFTIDDLAKAIGHDPHKVRFWATKAGSKMMYTPFEIKKRSGSPRTIHAPPIGLKRIQRDIAKWLQSYYRTHAAVHGYASGKSIVTNAKDHIKKREILSLDLENFFPSITSRRVAGLFKSPPFSFSIDVTNALVRLCMLPQFYGDGLPQGAPTSSIISNMIALRLDKQLLELAIKYKCRYTRYADDITFSFKNTLVPHDLAQRDPTNPTAIKLGVALSNAISAEGFFVNAAKTRIMSNLHCRQKVTGIVVNSTTNVDRRYIRKIRAMLHSMSINSEADALTKHLVKKRAHLKNHASKPYQLSTVARGMIAHVRAVKGYNDPVVLNLVQRYNRLSSTNKIRLPIPSHCIWKISDDLGNYGTAVSLKGLGLITCFHVINKGTKFNIVNEAFNERFSVTIGPTLPAIDIAQLQLVNPIRLPALESEEAIIPQQRALVEIHGFQTGGPQIGLSIVSTSVRARAKILPPDKGNLVVTLNGEVKDVASLECLHLNGEVFEGCSGGPVIDHKTNKVVGLIHKGRTSDTTDPVAPTVAIPSAYFKGINEKQISFKPHLVDYQGH